MQVRRTLSILALALLVTAGSAAAAAVAPAAAARTRAAVQSGRVPRGVKRVTVTVTYPELGKAMRAPLVRVLTSPSEVRALVTAVDRLKPLNRHGIMCPVLLVDRPVLRLVFSSGSGATLAQVRVSVSIGTGGDSGANICFPVMFQTGAGAQRSLVGKALVPLAGRLIGAVIS